MAKTIGIGLQDFQKIIKNHCFYIDKTEFIYEWWESKDDVTLIARPRRFGKTLNMSMTEQFFSVEYADRSDLFEPFSVWKREDYRNLQGTYPVISLSFSAVKGSDYQSVKERICQLLTDLYIKHAYLRNCDLMQEADKQFFDSVRVDMPEVVATLAVYKLSDYLYRYYGKKVIILLDEYDTPMQEAYVGGYWNQLAGFTRNLFNATFKSNPWLERALMTGITRVSRESIFSDLNNLKVVTATSEEYADSFGFTEEEVFAALDECGFADEKEQIKRWYDGFIFGTHREMYNPWSILNFLDTGVITTYWANTSSNNLIAKLLREGNRKIKEQFEILLQGGTIQSVIDEQIVYDQLDGNERAIWSLLLASGYLKAVSYEDYKGILEGSRPKYQLALTNLEVKLMFETMIQDWFQIAESDYNDFIKAMLQDDVDAMNEYMNRVALQIFSYFDVGKQPSQEEPERFYHGFVLGLIVELRNRYAIYSNRESGFGRYDVILEPKDTRQDDAIILEFKVFNKRKEQSLEETVIAAKKQIEEKQYEKQLIEHGILQERIRSYGFAFCGKEVLIG